MEAVARQFAPARKCLVIRNGWFSYRWSQIFEAGKIPSQETVLKARLVHDGNQAAFAPAPIEEVVAAIATEKHDLVFAPHVETSSGIILPDGYMRSVADAVYANGGMFVLDCIASGAIWADMGALGVDVLISAPQKGWSASPCGGLVMLSAVARARPESMTSSSFACYLRQCLQIMEAYKNGGFAYHATMPTDALVQFRDTMKETEAYGFDKVRALLVGKGFESVAAEGFQAPSVVVSYTGDADIRNGKKFSAQGMQIAAGVPLQCAAPENFSTFRLGLFGLDKPHNIDRTVDNLAKVIDQFE